MPKKVIGFLLIVAGVVLLLVETNKADWEDFISWSFLALLISLFLLFIAFSTQQGALVLVFGVAFTISTNVWGYHHVDGWPDHWSAVVFLFGISVILQFIVTKQPMTLIIGIVISLMSLFAWPGIREISLLAPFATILNTYWPILVLLLGVLYLFRKE
jgi:hypothetical protein